MKKRNGAPSSTERYVPAQFIRANGTVEAYPEYIVSDYGKVASMKGKIIKILKPQHNKLGYLQVCLCVNGKVYQRTVHRLVLSSFTPELWSKGTNEIDHKDRDPANNFLSNLVWTDRNGNLVNRAKRSLKQIKVTYLSDGHTEIFNNMVECSRAFGKHALWCSEIISRRNGYNAKYNILIEKLD